MLKVVVEKTYSFEELDKELQKELIEQHQYEEMEWGNWHEPIIEGWKDKLENLGYDNAEIHFSGFHSQGDGACFTCNIDDRLFLSHERHEGKFKCLLCDELSFTIKITHNWRYYFPTSTDVEFNYEEDYKKNQELKKAVHEILIPELEKFILKEREELGHQIYKDLQDYYEDLTSEETVKERLSQYKFNIGGKIIER